MKNMVATTALLFAAFLARAQMPQIPGSDPLSREILTKIAQKNGGVTAAVRVGSGQAIELKITDASSIPAASAPVAPRAAGVKAKKAPRRAVHRLKHLRVR